MKLIHTSPLGELEIAGVGIVEANTPFDVDAEFGAVLLEQSDLYHRAAPAKPRTPAKPKTAQRSKGDPE